MQSQVPKFRSFQRPAPSSTPDKDKEDRRPASTHQEKKVSVHVDDQQHDKRTSSTSHTTRHHHRSRGRQEATIRSTSQDKERRREKPERTLPSYDTQTEGRAWVVDSAGDLNILRYGSIERAKLPPYKSRNTRKALGQEDDFPKRPQVQPRPLLHLDRKALASLNEDDIQLGADAFSEERSTEAVDLGSQQDFIPLRPARKRKRDTGLASHIPGPPTDFRHQQSTDAAWDSGSESSSGETSSHRDTAIEKLSQEIRARHSALQHKVKSAPGNVSAWLEYIDFQGEWLKHGLDSTDTRNDSSSKTDARTLATLRLSIINDALSYPGYTAQDREKLLVLRMDQCEHLLAPSDLVSEWRNLVQENKGCSELWSRYLDFVQSRSQDFRFEDIKRIFEDRSAILSETDSPEIIVDMFLRLTTFLADAGFTEYATALWQTMLEVQFFFPSHLKCESDKTSSKTAITTAFEEFWDTECARIGEPDALGWTNVLQRGDPMSEHTSAILDHMRPAKTSLQAWACSETLHTLRFRLPGRTVDEEDNDPFHVVLFTDIEPFFRICCLQLPRAAIIDAFFAFCGLPPYPGLDVLDEKACLARNRGVTLGDLQTHGSKTWSSNAPSTNQEIDRIEREAAPGAQMRQWVSALENLLPRADGMLQAFHTLNTDATAFVSHALRRITESIPDDLNLLEYLIAFEYHTGLKRARKTAKTAIRLQPSNIRLYNAYALIESRSGNTEAADKIVCEALKLSRSTAPGELNWEDIVLCHTWVQDALLSPDFELASHRFATYVARKLNTDTNDVRDDLVESTLRQCLSTTLSVKSYDLTIRAVECLALSLYTSSGGRCSLQNACSFYSECIADLSSILPFVRIQELHQNYALFLQQHRRAGYPVVPATLCNILRHLRESISLFPGNYIIATTLAAFEPRTDRVRALLPQGKSSTVQRSPNSLAQWAFIITQELQRDELLGRTTHAVRRLFSNATGSEGGKHCGQLWAWWLQWECDIAQGNLSNSFEEHAVTERARKKGKDPQIELRNHRKKLYSRAHNTWLQGWSNLPGSKPWLLLGIQLLGEGVDTEQWLSYHDVMVDRGLRMTLDAREVVDNH